MNQGILLLLFPTEKTIYLSDEGSRGGVFDGGLTDSLWSDTAQKPRSVR
jgi:hypothetical protein